jgi:hypothetical protein
MYLCIYLFIFYFLFKKILATLAALPYPAPALPCLSPQIGNGLHKERVVRCRSPGFPKGFLVALLEDNDLEMQA